MSKHAFAGFPDDLTAFLADLDTNNAKPWFDANRQRYEDSYVTPALRFAAAIEAPLKKLAPAIRIEPKINGSLMRINRDVRFSKDKRPYKTWLHMMFWEGANKRTLAPAFYFGIDTGGLSLAAGLYGFTARQLAAYRDAVADEKSGSRLAAVIKRAGYEMGGKKLKRVPRGFDADHPRAELLCHKGLYVLHRKALPRVMKTAAAVDHCMAHYRKMRPVQKWLAEFLGEIA